MLRYEYLQSDFHPMFLFIGDSGDLAGLAAVLRRFARELKEVSMAEQLPEFHPCTPLMLLPAELEFGMRALGPEFARKFAWYLNPWQAEDIALRIERLAKEKSGSEIFEIGSQGEIPVKLSHGEFTDDFLISRR